jgi:hypothetical protein
MLYKYEEWGRGATHACTSPRENPAATSSRRNSETIVAHKVLAHPHVPFHPCMCGLRGDDIAVAVVLINYDNVGLLPRRPRRENDRDRLLALLQRATMLNRYSNSFSTSLRV